MGYQVVPLSSQDRVSLLPKQQHGVELKRVLLLKSIITYDTESFPECSGIPRVLGAWGSMSAFVPYPQDDPHMEWGLRQIILCRALPPIPQHFHRGITTMAHWPQRRCASQNGRRTLQPAKQENGWNTKCGRHPVLSGQRLPPGWHPAPRPVRYCQNAVETSFAGLGFFVSK